ncbi:hypothetical protein ACTHPH_12635 [Paenibacillus pasadenensis]|uniref:DUF2768 domain-containing protein n=1 Tax=Paenibacillus pasadenensis TaxID=217090 RepID=A0A2N5N397_9BACL|nr:hypothetical protein [Paenibacillus pasadenensis]PLT44805.1 hypothetical protein B8V81_3236 [Paenibacillus pasadenensis]
MDLLAMATMTFCVIFFLYAMRAIVNKESDRKFFALAVLASLCAGVSFLLLIGAIGSIIL